MKPAHDMPGKTATIKSVVSIFRKMSFLYTESVMEKLEEDRDLLAVVSKGLLAMEGIPDALLRIDRFCKGNTQPTLQQFLHRRSWRTISIKATS